MLASLSMLALSAWCGQDDLWFPGITRDSLWKNVQERCLATNAERHRDCAIVDRERGFVLYKDAIGPSHYLVIPDHKVTGIDDPEVWAAEKQNQWAFGWDARSIVGKSIDRSLPDSLVGLAINSKVSRSQDQLHIHLDCISESAREFVRGSGGSIGTTWSDFRYRGKPVRAVLIPSATPAMAFNPFEVIKESLRASPGPVADRGVFVTYVERPEGSSGFVIVDQPVDAAVGSYGHASDFLDRGCRLGRN